jgi:hypothetical protein
MMMDGRILVMMMMVNMVGWSSNEMLYYDAYSLDLTPPLM